MSDSLALMGVKGGPAIHPGSNMPTSMLLRMAGKTILIDAGLGVTRGICDQGAALNDIDLIVITHLHSDHYLELGAFFHTAWTAGLNRTIPVIGPAGIDAYWAAFQTSMAFDIDLRIRDEGRCDFGSLADIQIISDAHALGDIHLTTLRNDHPPITDTFALRFDGPNSSVVISGDTAYMPEMAPFAQNADLLVHEAMLRAGVDAVCARTPNTDDRLRTHILRSHTDATDVGKIAQDAGVKQLALNHFVPDSDPNFAAALWEKAVREHWDGPLFLGRDGLRITL